MQFFDSFLEAVLRPAWELVRLQWKGFIICFVLCLLVHFLHYKPKLDRYYELGSFVGNYRLAKGSGVTVSTGELDIHFNERLYRPTRKGTTHDSVLVFPSIAVYVKPSGNPRNCEGFEVGQRLGIDARYYYYTIELMELQTSPDTVAYFDVFRREYPTTTKKSP